jgi:hypothetical protein
MMKAAPVEAPNTVATALCIVLTLAFGIRCLYESTMMTTSILTHNSVPHAMIHAAANRGNARVMPFPGSHSIRENRYLYPHHFPNEALAIRSDER